LTYTTEWARGVIRPALQILNDLLFLAATLGLLVATSPVAGLLISLSAIILAGGLLRISQPKVAEQSAAKRGAVRIARITASEAIGVGRDVRLSGVGPPLVKMFAANISTYSECDSRARQWQLVPRLGIEIIGFVALIGFGLGALWSGMPRSEAAALL